MRETANRQATNAKRRSESGTDEGRERELKNILGTIENSSASGKSAYEPGAADCFQSVAAGDAERSQNVWSRRYVYKKRAEENCGPDAKSQDKQCRQRDASRRPYRGCARVQKREMEREFAGDEIDQRQGADRRQRGKFPEIHYPTACANRSTCYAARSLGQPICE